MCKCIKRQWCILSPYFFPLVFLSFNETCICHGIRPRESVKNSTIKELMGSYHICADGLVPYMPWWLPYMPSRHLYKETRCICERTNKDMAPLIYPCLLCVLVCCSRGLGWETGSIYDFYTSLSWDWEWKNESDNPWIGQFSTEGFLLRALSERSPNPARRYRPVSTDIFLIIASTILVLSQN